MKDFTVNFNNLLHNLKIYFSSIGQSPIKLFTFILDLAIVLFLIYQFIKYAKNTRLWQLIKGIIFVIVVVILSDLFQFKILNFMITAFVPYGVIALIIMFAPELRKMLEQLGTNKLTRLFGIDKDIYSKTKENIYRIVIAAAELSKQKIGALIVIERDIQINDIVEAGIKLNADISPQLLVNIFTPNTPLHDGAVIISDNKIAAAACILPLSDDKNISKELGTRHRAALGISKEADSIAIVVSEETGKISLAKDGTLIVDLKEEALRNILIKSVLIKKYGNETPKKLPKFVKRKKNKI